MNKKHYDAVFYLDIPAAYKVALLDRIAKECSVLAIYDQYENDEAHHRPQDFYDHSTGHLFDCVYLEGSSPYKRIRELDRILRGIDVGLFVTNGWDGVQFMHALVFSRVRMRSVIVESSIWDSSPDGVKGLVKSLLLKGCDLAFVPGHSNQMLMEALRFRGKIIQTGGVGIYNRIKGPCYAPKSQVRNFLYVGRLAPVKNLEYLVRTFNALPDLTLNIAGYGDLLEPLKSIAGSNVNFMGSINNKDLPAVYQSNDVFILPSIKEPWGLVVEEALNNGLPVIASDHVGCASSLIKTDVNGIVFDLQDKDGLYDAVGRMRDADYYNALRYNVCNTDFGLIEQAQVDCYVRQIVAKD